MAIFKIGRHNSISLGNKILTIFHLESHHGMRPREKIAFCVAEVWGEETRGGIIANRSLLQRRPQ